MSQEAAFHEKDEPNSYVGSEVDLLSLHEKRAGRLVLDPIEAKAELGEEVASRLKLTADGTKVLWPQPTDSLRDPQNWSSWRKHIQLFIITLAAFVPDFDSGIGVGVLYPIAKDFNTSIEAVNNGTHNWGVFLLGWGGIFAIMVVRRFGRLPVIFWSQVTGLAFLIGCTFAPNLRTFAAMRLLNGFFSTAPQVAGLYIITDIFPFHLHARKLNIWSMGLISSPFLAIFAFGFIVDRTTWRWAYGIGSLYSLFVVFLIMFFGEETMYDRTLKPIPEPTTTGLRYRVETLIGITGWKMAKYRLSWRESILSPIRVFLKPHLMLIWIFEAVLFGFGIGLNGTNVIFLRTPVAEGGRGFSQDAVAGSYATPIAAVAIGVLTGRYLNDWIMNVSVRRNKGVFEAESRLWACYVAIPLYICGFVTQGAAIQKHLDASATIIGWGLAYMAIMIGTVSIITYGNDCFPKHRGEVSALINLARTMGGFSVAYFQVPWAQKHGAIQTFGCEAAIVTGVFLLVVPFLQLRGRALRKHYSLH